MNNSKQDYRRSRPDVSIRNKNKKRPGIGKNIWLRFSDPSNHEEMKLLLEGVVIDQKILEAIKEVIDDESK